MKKSFIKILQSAFCLIVCFILSSCSLFGGDNSSLDSSDPLGGGEVEVNEVVFSVIDPLLQEQYVKEELPDVIKRISGSVVGLTVTLPSDENVFASGIVISRSNDGLSTYIATSHSSIVNAETVTVVDYKTGNSYNASPVGSDELTDVCVLKINATDLESAIFYNDLKTVEVGSKAIALANVMGEQTLLASDGIISAVNFSYDAGEQNIVKLYLTSVNAACTSLGGGIFSQQGGFLLGMIRTGYSVGMPTPFLPADELLSVCSEIIKNGYVLGRYKFGIAVQENKSSWGLPESVTVKTLSRDGLLYAGGLGLKEGDVIRSVTVKGEQLVINQSEDIYDCLYGTEFAIGDLISFDVVRNNVNMIITVSVVQYDYFK